MPTPTTKTLSLPELRGVADALMRGCVERERALTLWRERESHWQGNRLNILFLARFLVLGPGLGKGR